MEELILSSVVQQAIMNWLLTTGSPLNNSTMHLWKNSGVLPTNQSQLGDFTEADFQGYAAITGQSPLNVYVDSTGKWHAKFDSQEWQVANGAQQAGTLTVVGTVTMTGTLTLTATAAGETGSPRAVTVNVTNLDTAAQVAAKIVTAMNADADAGAFFNFSAAGAVVTMQAKTPAAEDSTMNLSLALGTATGITPVATWTQTVAGVAPVAPDETIFGVYLTDSTGTQYRGAAPFPTPIPLTAAFQDVNAWVDVPYGA